MTRGRIALPLTTLLVALSLAGCTAGQGEAAATPSVTATETASAGEVIDIRDQPGSVAGYVGASADVQLTQCAAQDGGVVVSGTLTNPETQAQSYRIYVSVLDDDATVGLVQVDVPDVAGSASQTWDTQVAVSAGGLSCALRVERFAP